MLHVSFRTPLVHVRDYRFVCRIPVSPMVVVWELGVFLGVCWGFFMYFKEKLDKCLKSSARG